MKLGFFVNILFFLLSCGGKQQGGIPVYSVDVLQRDSVNHFFSGYEYVMLETNENCLLGEVKGMKVYDSVIGIRERERILLFGHDGKFISKIDKKGRGAGEYLSVEDFCVRDSLVYVLSGAYKSILVYGMSGTFVRKIELGDWYGHFEVLDDELMFLSSEYNNENDITLWCSIMSNRRMRLSFPLSRQMKALHSGTFFHFVEPMTMAGMRSFLLIVPIRYISWTSPALRLIADLSSIQKIGLKKVCHYSIYTRGLVAGM